MARGYYAMLQQMPDWSRISANLANTLMRGNELKHAEAERKRARAERAAAAEAADQQDQLLSLARREAMGGNETPLAQIAPNELGAIRAARQSQREGAAKEQRTVARALKAAGGDPEKERMVLEYAKRRGIDMSQFGQMGMESRELAGPQLPQRQEQPEGVDAMTGADPGLQQQPLMSMAQERTFDAKRAASELGTEADSVLGREEQKLHTEAQKYLAARGIMPGSPGYVDKLDSVSRMLHERKTARAKAGAARISATSTTAPLTTSTESKQQGKVLDAEAQLALLDNIERSIEDAGGYDELGNYWEQGKDYLQKLKANIGVASGAEKARLERRFKAVANIGEMTNAVISLRGGANVPPAEFKRLTESLPRPEDSGPLLKAKIAAMRENLSIIRNMGQKALFEGIKNRKIALPGVQMPPVRTDPATGERRQYVDGAWVPIKEQRWDESTKSWVEVSQ
jgi:hypothetical protein